MLHRMCILLLNLIFPPLAVSLMRGVGHHDTLLNACLFLLAIIPSHIHGMIVSWRFFKEKNAKKRQIKQEEAVLREKMRRRSQSRSRNRNGGSRSRSRSRSKSRNKNANRRSGRYPAAEDNMQRISSASGDIDYYPDGTRAQVRALESPREIYNNDIMYRSHSDPRRSGMNDQQALTHHYS